MINIVDNPPSGSYLNYFRNVLNLSITPLAPVHRMMHHGPSKKLLVKGKKLGLLFLRSSTNFSTSFQAYTLYISLPSRGIKNMMPSIYKLMSYHISYPFFLKKPNTKSIKGITNAIVTLYSGNM